MFLPIAMKLVTMKRHCRYFSRQCAY